MLSDYLNTTVYQRRLKRVFNLVSTPSDATLVHHLSVSCFKSSSFAKYHLQGCCFSNQYGECQNTSHRSSKINFLYHFAVDFKTTDFITNIALHSFLAHQRNGYVNGMCKTEMEVKTTNIVFSIRLEYCT